MSARDIRKTEEGLIRIHPDLPAAEIRFSDMAGLNQKRTDQISMRDKSNLRSLPVIC